jgi:integration host factor subunit beta
VAKAFPGLRYIQIQKAVSGIFKEIIHSVNKGNRVELRGFGVFFVSSRKPRLGRNPKTGEAVAIPAKKKPSFRAGRNLREKMNLKPEMQSLREVGKIRIIKQERRAGSLSEAYD